MNVFQVEQELQWDLFRPYLTDLGRDEEPVKELLWQMNELPNMMGRVLSNGWYEETVIWLLWVVRSTKVKDRRTLLEQHDSQAVFRLLNF